MSTNLSQQRRDKLLNNIKIMREKLKENPELVKSLADIESELQRKKYGLIWEEHEERVDEELKKKIPVFEEVKEREIINKVKGINYLIEGDNLHSLYLLEKTHKEKIDVIYIDPPYNTGKKDEWKYNDSWVDENDSYKHSKWLSFMQRRLEIANKLLSKTGVMFISIDEHEVSQLSLLCQDIFGENNIDYLIWQKTDSRVDRNTNAKIIHRYKNIHETILICYKNKNSTHFEKMMKLPEWKNKQTNPDKDPRGPWSSGIISYEEGHKNEDKNSKMYYSITTPSGKVYTRHWFVTQEEFEKLRKDNRISFPKNGDGVPRLKTFENEEKEYHMDSILRGVGTSSTAKDELIDIFNDRTIFDTPKPTKLIKELVRVASNKDSIILDFFAGSGTTGQAVLELNKEDGGHRCFVLCTNNENNICESITYQRLKTVITGRKNNGEEFSNVILANLKYYKTEYIDRFNHEDDGYYIVNELSKYIKELVQLENGVDINNKSVQLLFTDEEVDEFSRNDELIKQCKIVYIDTNALITDEQAKRFEDNNISIMYIPEYYFEEEIMEVEQW